MIDIVEVNRLEDLAEWRDEWRRAFDATPNRSFFQTLEWLEATWDSYPLRQKLRVLIIRRDGEVIGVVPLCVRTESRKVGPVRVLTYPLVDWGTFYGPLTAEPEAVLPAALRHIQQTRRDWDTIDLRWVDDASPERELTSQALDDAGFAHSVRPRMEVRTLELPGSWDELVAGKSHSWRRKMKRDVARLEREGEVELVRYRPTGGEPGSAGADPRWDLFDACLEVARRSWQANSPLDAGFSSERLLGVLRRTHEAAARLGMLDVCLLYLNGRPVAFVYNYVTDGAVYGLRNGFDAEANAPGCGMVLFYKMIEDSCRRGDHEISFGPGRQEYKNRLANRMRHSTAMLHYAPWSARSRVLQLRDAVKTRVQGRERVWEKGLIT